jgi:hypothetical protein
MIAKINQPAQAIIAPTHDTPSLYDVDDFGLVFISRYVGYIRDLLGCSRVSAISQGHALLE